MSLNLLKRELDKDLEEFEAKKQKTISKKKGEGKNAKATKTKEPTRECFEFNDRDYSIEEDYTKECLKYLGVLDKKLPSVNSDRIIQRNLKAKRQDKIMLDTGTADKGSIFTDEDFEMLSQLHFVNSHKAIIVDKYTGDKSEMQVITDGKKKTVKKIKKKKKKSNTGDKSEMQVITDGKKKTVEKIKKKKKKSKEEK